MSGAESGDPVDSPTEREQVGAEAAAPHDRPLRVLQLVTTRRPFFEQQVEALEEQGVDCTTVTVPAPEEGGRSAVEYLRFQMRVLRRVLFGEYDVIHANYGLIGPLALVQPSRPVVLTLWGSDAMGADWLVRLSKVAARHSDAVIVPSEPVGELFDCPHRLIPFGVDMDVFRPMSRADCRRALDWPDEPTVLFPYPPSREVKNYPLAEEVVESLSRDRGEDVTLRTMSGVPHKRVPIYMNAADAVVVTSHRESGPMVVKEAAACNVPVVSADVGFASQVLDGVDNSYVCSETGEFVDALSSVLDSDGRSNGRRRIDALGLERMAEDIIDVYGDVIDR